MKTEPGAFHPPAVLLSDGVPRTTVVVDGVRSSHEVVSS